MNKKAQRISRIFAGVINAQGGDAADGGKAQLTERAIWMSARELGAGQITMFAHGDGHGIEIDLSPSAVMAAFDRNNDEDSEGITVYLTTNPSMEIYGVNSRDSSSEVFSWEDMLQASRPQREAPKSIMIDGREYTLHSSHTDAESADRERDKVRESGKNAQIRRKGGMFRVYVRDKAPRKAPAKKAAKKKAPAKKAAKKKTPQPKAKKPSSKKKAGGKGKA